MRVWIWIIQPWRQRLRLRLCKHCVFIFSAGGCRRRFREDQDRTRQQRHKPRVAPRQSGDQTTAQEGKGSSKSTLLFRVFFFMKLLTD